MVTNQPVRQKSYILHLTRTLSELDREFFCIHHSSRGTILCRLASRASSLVGNYSFLCKSQRWLLLFDSKSEPTWPIEGLLTVNVLKELLLQNYCHKQHVSILYVLLKFQLTLYIGFSCNPLRVSAMLKYVACVLPYLYFQKKTQSSVTKLC